MAGKMKPAGDEGRDNALPVEGNDAQPVVAPPQPVVTVDMLRGQLNTAIENEDYAAVAKLAGQIKSIQAKEQNAVNEAKLEALKELTMSVQTAITEAVKPFLSDIEAKKGDGVWFVMDFGDAGLVNTRLVKTTPKAPKSSGGGGGGKVFDDKTVDLLTQFGSMAYKDTGMSCQEAHDTAVEGNAKYQVRIALLKHAGKM